MSADGLDHEAATELLDELTEDSLLVYPLGPARVWAYKREDYLMLVRDRGGHYTQSSTTRDRVVDHLQDAFWTDNFGTEPAVIPTEDAPDNVRRAAE